MVSFNERGQLPPVVFFHMWDAESDHLNALAETLGPEQPLHGIQPPSNHVPQSFDEWVAHHRSGLDSLPIDPPYRLAGWSFGGVAALEVARGLQAEGVAVAWLGLVDTIRPVRLPKGVGPYARHHLREFRALTDNPLRLKYLRWLAGGSAKRTFLRVRLRTNRILARLRPEHERPMSVAEVKGWSPLQHSGAVSYRRYEARPYDHPVELFVGESYRDTTYGVVTLGWSRYLSRLTVSRIEGSHLELFSPENIDSLGRAIQTSLGVARARSEVTG
ncbi:MAG: phthiocerol/phenolphthiocerol synthesis type-I polyketide synthase [Acidimicrobiaceae bacterium]